jgi:GT2 family glycosyltransferase
VPWSVSVIVTTYNKSDELRLTVASLEEQLTQPDEVVIADDGSNVEHVEAIEKIITESSLNIIHAWQPDKGFRLAASRNNGVRRSSEDYLIFIDGDVVLLPEAIDQHLQISKSNCWVNAHAVSLNEQETQQVTLEQIRDRKLHELWPDSNDPRHGKQIYEAKRFKRLSMQSRFLPFENRFRKLNLIGLHFSLPREACEKVNGFDENYEGWGQEDLDFGLRMLLAGYRARTVRDTARAFHLYHQQAVAAAENWDYFKRPRGGLFKCEHGLFSPKEPDHASVGPE